MSIQKRDSFDTLTFLVGPLEGAVASLQHIFRFPFFDDYVSNTFENNYNYFNRHPPCNHDFYFTRSSFCFTLLYLDDFLLLPPLLLADPSEILDYHLILLITTLLQGQKRKK